MAEKNVRIRRQPCSSCGYGVMIRMNRCNGDDAYRCMNCGHVKHEIPPQIQTPPKGVTK